MRRTITVADISIEALRHEIELLREEIVIRMEAASQLLDEKMEQVGRQFQMIEDYRKEAKGDSRKEVDAALAAQKEAINKSEVFFHQEITNLRRDLDETKRRITSVE